MAFLNTRGWNEEKCRMLLEEENKCYDVVAVRETGWHDHVEWQGEWMCIGKGRKIGEKKGVGVGVRQGCVMPPTLFNIYTEEVLVRIRLSGQGN